MRGSGRLRLLLVLAVLTAFTLTAIDFRTGGGSSPFDGVRRLSDAAFGPAKRALGGAVGSAGDAVDRLRSRDRDELRRLREENDRLAAQLRETEGLRAQVREWTELLALKDRGDYTVVPAKVTALGSSLGFELTATIDAGSRDGIRENQTVVTGRGLVGRTKRVGPYTSVVVLLGDRDFSVGIRVLRTGRLGIATGDGLGSLTYQLLGQNARAEVGDAVATTGSSTFVAGVPVGRVRSTDTDPNALTRTGKLTPYADLDALDLVGVVVDGPRTVPRAPLRPSAPPQATQRASPSPRMTR